MNTDHFAHKAATFEQNRSQVDNVQSIADAILATFPLRPDMHLVDFGSGTGLLLERIAPHVGLITAVDTSPAMNQQLEAKRDRLACRLDIQEVELEQALLLTPVDGVISSMTLHHVEDIPALFNTLHGLVPPGSFIALADLETEDGSFHSDNTGVFHFGFDPEKLAKMAEAAGFSEVKTQRVSEIPKPQRDFPVFLLTARA